MKYSFTVSREQIEDNIYWIARCSAVSTIIGQGNTPDEAVAELEDNERMWLETASSLGLEIPEEQPVHRRNYSGKFMTRISPSEHATAVAFATADGISLNQYVSNAIAYYNGYNERMHINSNVVAVDFGSVDRKQM